jgi:hypothetical protein
MTIKTSEFYPINSQIDYIKILSEITEKSIPHSYPHTIECPFCHKETFDTFPDFIFGGHWHCCKSCQFSGNTIYLWSKYINLPIDLAILDLNKKNNFIFSEIMDEYIKEQESIIKKQNYIKAWWEKIKSRHHHLPGSIQTNLCFGAKIACWNNPQLWCRRVGLWTNIVQEDDIKELFQEFVVKRKPLNLFKKDSRVWVIPFFDLPGRLSGIVLRTKDKTELELPLNCDAIQGEMYGVAAHQGFYSKSKHFSNYLFVFLNPEFATSLQLMHMGQISEPIPVVGIYENSTTPDWLRQWSEYKNIIFISSEFNHYILKHAYQLNSKIAIIDSINKKPIDYYKNTNQFLSSILRVAQQWQLFLKNTIINKPSLQVEKCVKYAKLTIKDVQQLDIYCKTKTEKETLQQFIERISQSNQVVVVNSKTIVETPQGWKIQKNNEYITDFTVKIIKVIRSDNNKLIQYYGEINYKNQRIPFIENKTKFDKNPFKWVQDYILSKNIGLVNFNPKWQKQAINIITKLYTPEIITNSFILGWDSNTKQFKFPNFIINADGSVVDNITKDNFKKFKYFNNIQKPGNLTPAELSALKENPKEASRFWTLAFLLAYNLLAPLKLAKPRGIFIMRGCQRIKEMAPYFGCSFFFNDTDVAYGTQWPSFFDWNYCKEQTRNRLKKRRNCFILNAPHLVALVSQANYTGLTAVIEDVEKWPDEFFTIAEKFPASFCKYFIETKTTAHRIYLSFWSILKNMVYWGITQGIDKHQISTINRYILINRGIKCAMCILSYFYKQNKIGVFGVNNSEKTHKHNIIKNENDLWFSLNDFNELLIEEKQEPFDIKKVQTQKHWNNSTKLILQKNETGELGIKFSEKTWFRYLNKWNADPDFGIRSARLKDRLSEPIVPDPANSACNAIWRNRQNLQNEQNHPINLDCVEWYRDLDL